MAPEQPVYKMEGWSKFRQTPQIKACDMVLEMEVEAKDVIILNIDKVLASRDYEVAVNDIKNQLDRKYGGPWHCVLGEGFGMNIVHQARQMIHVHYQGVSCICFKC